MANPAAVPGMTAELTSAEIEEAPFVARARDMIQAYEAELAAQSTTAQSSPAREARLHFDIARLSETPLRDLRKAATHYQEALKRMPEHLPTLRGARRVLLARKNFQAAMPLFDAEARITSNAAEKAALYLAKGRVLEDALGSKDDARKAYELALGLDASDPAILKAVDQGEYEKEAWQALEQTIEREANAVSSDVKHRAALLVQRARLLERKGRIDAASEQYETSLRLDTRAEGAVPALKRLHHGQRRWRDLIRVLELEAEQSTDRRVRTLAHYRIGRIHGEKLGNQDEALGAFERAAHESPEDGLVLAELAHLYETVERWEALVEILQRQADACRGPEERIGLVHRIGQLHEEKLGNDDAATQWYEAALTIDPVYLPALQALSKLYVRRDDYAQLVRMHQAEAEHSKQAERRAAAYARIAELQETKLDQVDLAMEHHAKALAQVPGYGPSFKTLTRLLAQANRWRELIELYERAVEQATERDSRVAYLLKIGSVYEDALHEYVPASQAYRRVIDMDGDHLGAIHALQRATERAGRYEELVRALDLEASKLANKRQIVALLHRAGEVMDDKLGNRDGALQRYRKALEIDPKYVPALASLGRIYYRMGRWEDLLDMYKRELELTSTGASSVTLLQKMGELCEEKLGRLDLAAGYYRKALEQESTYTPALSALSRILRAQQQWQDLIKVLDMELAANTDPNAQARNAFRMGEVYEAHLENTDRALAAYEQALKHKPDYRPAIDALSRLRAERKAYTKLVEELAREVETTRDPHLIMSAWMRQGLVYSDDLGEPRRAIASFEKVLERDPNHVAALLELERLYRKVGAHSELATIYATLSRCLLDERAKLSALRELHRLQETRPGLVDGDPRSTCEAILAIAPTDLTALSALERIALATGNHALLAQVDARLAELADDPHVKATYLCRLAESLESQGDDNAMQAYQRALALDNENLSATRGLARMAARLDDPEAIADAARRMAHIAFDKPSAAQALVHSAAVRSERLHDMAGARADLERALELSPDNPEAAERLGAMLLNAGEAGRLADILARAATSASNAEQAAQLWLEVARIQADVLENLTGGITALNRVLKQDPQHVATLRRLADYYSRDGQFSEAVNLLMRVVQLAPDRIVMRDTHLDLARLWDERLNQSARAMVSLQAALGLEPDNEKALLRLCEIHERAGRLDEAAEAAERLIKATEKPTDRGHAMLKLARIQQALGDEGGWFDTLRQAVALQGPASEAAQELKSQINTPTQWERYAEAVTGYLSRIERTDVDATPVYLELSRVRHDQLAQPNAAVELLQQGLSATQDSVPLRVELSTRLRMAGRHPEAVAELQKLLSKDLTRIETWRDLSRTYEQQRAADYMRLALLPLELLEAASPAELEFIQNSPPRPGQARSASVDAKILELLSPPRPGEAEANALLSAVGEALAKLYPPDFEAYGLSARDRVSTRHGHPLRQAADRVAMILGVEGLDLYIHRVRGRTPTVEFGSPTALMLPASLSEAPRSRQVFEITRPLVAMTRGLHPLLKLTPLEIEVLLATAARLVEPGFGQGLTSEDLFNEQLKRLQKALSRRARKQAEEAAHAYVNAPPVDFVGWAQRADKIALRVASVLSDDLMEVVATLRQSDRELAGQRGAALVRRPGPIADVLKFWLSESALSLRRRAGMLGRSDSSSTDLSQ